MTEYKGILLVVSGKNIAVLESQVIMHAISMKKHGINLEVWFLIPPGKDFMVVVSTFKERYPELSIKVINGVRPKVPFSMIINAVILAICVRNFSKTPYFIQSRSQYATAVAGLAKIFNDFCLIWDVRGDAENELILAAKNWSIKDKILKFFPALLGHRLLKLLSDKFANGGIFVSEKLKKNLAKSVVKRPCEIIPCVAEASLFYFCSNTRKIMRDELRLFHDEKIIIYSGSLSVWQCADEMFQLVKILFSIDESFKFIILTPELDLAANYIEKYKLDVNRVIAKTVILKDINKYLNAADFALCLRDKIKCSEVASPVKFAEYCLAGLPVIMTDAVEQATKYAKEFGNFIAHDFWQHTNLSLKAYADEQRLCIAKKAKVLLSREAIASKYIALYSRLGFN
jgi:hypothetical protein